MPNFRALAALFFVSCGSSTPPPVDPPGRRAAWFAQLRDTLGETWDLPAEEVFRDADLAEGHAIYQKSCGPCHGRSLQGDGPRAAGMVPRPQPLTNPELVSLTPSAYVAIITNGSPNTGMPPWSRAFTAEQIRNVSAWVWSQQTSHNVVSPP